MTQDPTGPAGWPGADLAALLSEWWRPFLSGSRPSVFASQPILPGWTFGPNLTINAGNSSAPQTEVEVLRRHSYGRQLGRITDVLEVLVGNLGRGARDDQRVTSFLEMTEEIKAVKLDAAKQRVVQLKSDLATLKSADPNEYERLRAALRAALDLD
jgi:hypothetical protein